MINQYPTWKYIAILLLIITLGLYALPNLYDEDYAIQLSPNRSVKITDEIKTKLETALQQANIEIKASEQYPEKLLLRLNSEQDQLKAVEILKHHQELGDGRYTIALNLAPTTPAWLRSLNAEPMYLGLDLRGGVHFLLEVDMPAAIRQAYESYASDIRALLKAQKIRYKQIKYDTNAITIILRKREDRQSTLSLLEKQMTDVTVKESEQDGKPALIVKLSESKQKEVKKFALEQNITTLRNRVNELGVAEPVIQQQGENRIVVQLPGIQDTAYAKSILGATATLEFRLVDNQHDAYQATQGKVPLNSKLYYDTDRRPVLLNKRVIVTGNQIIDAASGIESRSGTPAVFITLNGSGAKKMSDITAKNVGQPMAVVFIEKKTRTKIVDGKAVKTSRLVEEVINVATIRDHLSKRFQISGLDSTREARNLALLLRAGALAAPIEIVEERTVGPSLGQTNIDQGFLSVILGFVLVLVFMAGYYRVFGLVADLALAVNLVLMVAILSLLQATLTLPGIAGIVLTVGMAVDANVLIFERIREELRNGNSPQASIYAGYEKALSTITDANITTFIAAVVLFSFGTGPIKGFAVTLSIGIATSMFTAIIGTRAVVNLIYGHRRVVKKLAI